MSVSKNALRIEVPEKLVPLLQPARYKGAHGGRGGAKSHFFAQLAVIKAYSQPGARIVCIREVQNTIKDSVKHLIESKIDRMGLSGYFEPMVSEIRTKSGGLIAFKGMQDYNADNIKSLEDFDVAWIEEAQNLSARSLRLLRPTIRKPGSEIWASWNPRWDTDPIDEFFRGAHKPDGAVCVEVNWRDNPWLPEVLKAEMARDFAADPEMAEHVWNGGYEIVSEGAYFARLIAQAEKEGRVGKFPYKPGQKVVTAWDLGIRDHMVCWFIVEDAMHATVVDFYEASGEDFAEFCSVCLPEVFVPPDYDHSYRDWSQVKAFEHLKREIPFLYGHHYLPHDVKNRELGAGRRHRFQVLESLGVKPLRKGVPTSDEERIGAVRRLLPQIRFNDTPRVQLGLKRLRRFRRKFNDTLGTYTGVFEDDNVHAADAFGEYCVNSDLTPPNPKPVSEKPKDELIIGVDEKTGQFKSNVDHVRELVRMKERLAKTRKPQGLRL